MNLGQFSTCCEPTGTGAPAWIQMGVWWTGIWYRMGTRAVSLTVPLELSPPQTELVPPRCLPTFASTTIIACRTEGCVRIDREFRGREHVWNTANIPQMLVCTVVFQSLSFLWKTHPYRQWGVLHLSGKAMSYGSSSLYRYMHVFIYVCVPMLCVCVCPCTCVWRPEDYLEHHSLNSVMWVLFVLWQGFSLAWDLPSRPGQLANKPQKFHSLPPYTHMAKYWNHTYTLLHSTLLPVC